MKASNRPPADVCLILEGSYPYVAGGVSSWMHDLIMSQPHLRFTIVALVAATTPTELRYELPANVDGVLRVPLAGPPRGGATFNIRWLTREITPLLVEIQQDAGLAAFIGVVDAMARSRRRLGSAGLMNSPPAWEMITAMYEKAAPESSFLEYFWTWRALHGGLFATLLCPLPAARMYHTISTGYAGLVAARAAVETGRPAVLTEHGIYTN